MRPPIIAWNIGHSRASETLRNIGRGIPEMGYAAWAESTLAPIVERGFRRLHLHNPGGANTGEAMDFDQFSEMDQSWWRVMRRHEWVRRLGSQSFREAFLALAAKYPTAEVVSYLGTISGDNDRPDAQAEPGRWLEWATRSVRPLLDCRHQIGMDASSGIVAGSAEHRFFELLDALGAAPIVEAWPSRTATHLHHYDCLMVIRSDGSGSFGSYLNHPASPRGLMTGELRILLHGAFDDQQFEDTVRRIVSEGATPMISSGRIDDWIRMFGHPDSPSPEPA